MSAPGTYDRPKLFTAGPVEMFPDTIQIGGTQLPYFRTPEFSEITKSCESIMLDLVEAPEGSRAIFLTASGTGAMEAAVLNLLGPTDRALIIAGGSFGERFCEICEVNGIPFDALPLAPGSSLPPDQIERLQLGGYKVLLVNAHETSTGVLYDLMRLGAACARVGTLFLVDGISAFLCDALSMSQMKIDLLLTASQKALALAPGLSVVMLSPRALNVVSKQKARSYYFGFERYLTDGTRGQTPFTPAVGIILQLHNRLKVVQAAGPLAIIQHTAGLARHFRALIEGLPFRCFAESPSNALTALSPTNGSSAFDIFNALKTRFNLVVTPNGGPLRDTVFRVGHMGNLCQPDMEAVAHALGEISQ